MEDFVIIDSVLQAIHMSKYKPKPKHIKKYEISSCKSSKVPRDNYTICYEPSSPHNWDSEQKQKSNNMFQTQPLSNRNQYFFNFGAEGNEKNKVKTKFILEDSEKLQAERDQQNNRQYNQEFFIKKLIDPKKNRSHTSRINRAATLCKSPQVVKGLFYDVNIETVRKKSRKCIIFPERRVKIKEEVGKNQQECGSKQVNIKQLIHQQWQQQRRRRRAECKTSLNHARHKNQIQKQARRIEQSLRNKQNEQKYLLKQAMSDRNNSNRRFYYEEFTQSTLPLSKQEMKAKTSFIMHKYGVDSGKCYYKFIN